MTSAHNDVASHRIGAICFIVDVVLIIAIVVQNHSHFVPPPTTGIDASATIGWLSVVAAIIIFGCYGYVAVSSARWSYSLSHCSLFSLPLDPHHCRCALHDAPCYSADVWAAC